MKGSYRFGAVLALLGFVLTFLVSLSTNILSTSLIRGLVSGALLYLVGTAAHWILRFVAEPGTPHLTELRTEEGEAAENLGQTLDLSTPDEREKLNRIIRQPDSSQAAGAAFEPLHPPKLTTKPEQAAQQLADALRTMSEK